MDLLFDVSPHDGDMTVYARYDRSDIAAPHFYVNRDTLFESIICDGKDVTTDIDIVCHPMFESERYMVLLRKIFSYSALLISSNIVTASYQYVTVPRHKPL